MSRCIFVYHAVEDGWQFSAATVATRRFREQCAALDDAGYRGLRLDVAALGSDDCTFGLTVDDGYESLLRVVVPECARYGWTGTAFVPTRLVGSRGTWDVGSLRKHRHLTWPGLREVATQGWEIGVHGASHRALTDMPLDEAEREMREARDEAEQQLGLPVRSVAYPFGAVSAQVADAARRAGFQRGATMRPAQLTRTTDPMRLPRWPVYRTDRADHVVVRLAGPRWAQELERAKVWTIQSYANGTRVRMRGAAV